MDFHFYDLEDEMSKLKVDKAIVRVSIDKDFPVIRVDVDLDEIPGED